MANADYLKFKQLYNSKELFHHGVKGQKWGVRKEPEPTELDYLKRIAELLEAQNAPAPKAEKKNQQKRVNNQKNKI